MLGSPNLVHVMALRYALRLILDPKGQDSRIRKWVGDQNSDIMHLRFNLIQYVAPLFATAVGRKFAVVQKVNRCR